MASHSHKDSAGGDSSRIKFSLKERVKVLQFQFWEQTAKNTTNYFSCLGCDSMLIMLVMTRINRIITMRLCILHNIYDMFRERKKIDNVHALWCLGVVSAQHIRKRRIQARPAVWPQRPVESAVQRRSGGERVARV